MKKGNQDYKGRKIDLKVEGDRPQLIIDGRRMRLGELPGGLYFLHEYAYDWTDDPVELGRRYVDYRAKVDANRRGRQTREG